MTADEVARLLQPGCPWVPLREWGGLPNVKWCEETLCAWAAEPANTWSNLAYVLVGLVLFLVSRREPSRTLRFFAPAAVIVGSASLVYHASVAFVTQVLDFWGMYFYFLLLVGLNLVRMGKLPGRRFFPVLWPSIFGFTLLTVVVAKLGLPVQGIVLALVALTLATEVLASRALPVPTHRWFFLTLAIITVATACSVADASRLFCTPTNHVIQGHAAWHALGSGALLSSYFHYRQFRDRFV